ncbi:MAG: hypothetical protein QOD29_3952, partial [Alphaproteobacteria bacterium]|nr:hypothetical protein [Alphaproteobacteria bacterium]
TTTEEPPVLLHPPIDYLSPVLANLPEA